MRYLILFSLSLLIFACEKKETTKLNQGTYRVDLQLNDSLNLPFVMDVEDATHLKVFNAEEVIEVDEVTYENDSVFIKMPVFEGYLVAKINKDKLIGKFVKPNLKRDVPFIAYKGTNRFDTGEQPNFDITGNWETVFSPDSKTDRYIAKGIFKQNGSKVTGTFRTTTGDYRFLEGVVNGDSLKLSTFDGAHAFLFTGKGNDSTLEGTFYSGSHWKEPFVAKLNNSYELPDANDLTFLNEGFDKIEFSFPDVHGNLVSLGDDRFKDKVVLVQIMGTWCPNCLDESRFYAKYYEQHKSKDFEIVALAFEYVKTDSLAFKNIERLTNRIGIDYPVLLAQTGTASKKKAQEKLPMLNHVLSYPTTIFIDKKGVVRKIHTGFDGPATGEKYLTFKSEFENYMTMLISE